MFSCGPLRGWVRTYLVQPGDNLFQIAERYHTTVAALERANCTPNSFIYAGERLWIPYVPMMTEGQTVILMFDTPTDSPTESPTSTPYDPTPTVPSTDTVSPTP
jgi:LysM repeat protein